MVTYIYDYFRMIFWSFCHVINLHYFNFGFFLRWILYLFAGSWWRKKRAIIYTRCWRSICDTEKALEGLAVKWKIFKKEDNSYFPSSKNILKDFILYWNWFFIHHSFFNWMHSIYSFCFYFNLLCQLHGILLL